MTLATFIKDFKSQSKTFMFDMYEKEDLVKYCKKLGVDACKTNTKDMLYKKIKVALAGSGSPIMKGG